MVESSASHGPDPGVNESAAAAPLPAHLNLKQLSRVYDLAPADLQVLLVDGIDLATLPQLLDLLAYYEQTPAQLVQVVRGFGAAEHLVLRARWADFAESVCRIYRVMTDPSTAAEGELELAWLGGFPRLLELLRSLGVSAQVTWAVTQQAAARLMEWCVSRDVPLSSELLWQSLVVVPIAAAIHALGAVIYAGYALAC